MENFIIFLDYIARTNLFNFVIFLSIIIFLIKKVDVSLLLEKEKNFVKESIEESNVTKEESEVRLSDIEQSLSNISAEIDSIIKKSQKNAELVGAKLIEDGHKSALILQENTTKAIENAQTILKNDLIKKASKASIEVARNHIINELNNNKELHDKLIDESIEAISEVDKI